MENLPNERLVLTPHAIKRHSRRLQQEIKDLFNNVSTTDLSDFSLSQSQNMLARILGMKDYHEMHKVLCNDCDTNEIILDPETQDIERTLSNVIIPKQGHYINLNNFLSQISHIEDIRNISLQSDSMIYIEFNRKLYKINRICNNQELISIITQIYGSESALNILNNGNDIDLPYSLRINRETTIHFRINITSILINGEKGYSILIRKLSNKIIDFNKLIVNQNLKTALNKTKGIVIVGGASGSGKKYFLHSYLQDKINNEEKILRTYQYVLDYIYNSSTSSSVYQSQIGVHLPNMDYAIKNANRHTVDLLLFEEIRTLEETKSLTTTAISFNEEGKNASIYTTTNSSSIENTLLRMFRVLEKNENDYLDLISELSLIIQQHVIVNENNKVLYLQSYLEFTPKLKNILMNFITSNTANLNSFNFRVFLNKGIEKYGMSEGGALEEAFSKNLINDKTYMKYQQLINNKILNV